MRRSPAALQAEYWEAVPRGPVPPAAARPDIFDVPVEMAVALCRSPLADLVRRRAAAGDAPERHAEAAVVDGQFCARVAWGDGRQVFLPLTVKPLRGEP